MTNNSLAIIPARGGSKRIPRKNIKLFLGKPIITYSIEIALESGLFSEVMVSTDDEEIADLALRHGASVPFFRSTANADDFSTTIDVLKEVEREYKDQLQRKFDFICCLYPTAPLVKISHLQKGYDLIRTSKSASVFPIAPFSYPIWRGLEVKDSKVQMVWPEFQNSRSQDLKTFYHDAGQWYWYDPLKIHHSLFTLNSSPILLQEEEVQDIDTLTDWKLAEIKYKLLHED